MKVIFLSLYFFLFCKSSLRGTRKILERIGQHVNHECPCHSVVGDWVMRYGLYRLLRNRRKRKDWIYIIDHTIEIGSKSAFVVLGVPLHEFRRRKANRNLTCKDVEVLAIEIVESATGESVHQCLEETAGRFGIPVQVVSDGGLNIKAGLREFIGNHPGVRQTYDITHASALILKKELEHDKKWLEFSRRITEAKRLLTHTPLAYLVPPKPRDKARYMNLEMMVGWAEGICNLSLREIEKAHRAKFREKLGWLSDFHGEIARWRAMLNVLEIAKQEVKGMGLRSGTAARFRRAAQQVRVDYGGGKQRGRPCAGLDEIRSKLEAHLTEQTCGMTRGAYLGCSDIIESLFGSYKRFSSEAPVKEIGRSILAMPALAGELTPSEVKKAMETISQKKLKKWLRQNFGESLLTKRKKVSFKLKSQKHGEEKNEKTKKTA